MTAWLVPPRLLSPDATIGINPTWWRILSEVVRAKGERTSHSAEGMYMASKECEDVDQLEGMITDLLTSPTLHTPDGMVSATDWVYQAPLQRAQRLVSLDEFGALLSQARIDAPDGEGPNRGLWFGEASIK
ncbi:hypothetical protein AK812_SmicGene2204 [Symbiodinium microadriaticum]|uniref:Uncharacterized protein n=1 Tax=Symbiodinium microadriaticum TaxID=2951 RepID=A0A1Q9F1Z8_SYMMI|nr:hypothetical protein AK812_SmicGene2204 [Symbiodinium microadriaticum]